MAEIKDCIGKNVKNKQRQHYNKIGGRKDKRSSKEYYITL